ncbi:tyrosine-type recombinase/integrase [Pantoea anthophila]|uniref:tyrosine-type recombinase/integrase n=1 Tax=Pantoea anthophila TaxID=470931 RepID=UPI003CF7C178
MIKRPESYDANLPRNTLRLRKYQLNAIRKSLGDLAMNAVTTRDIALFLDVCVIENKQTMAVILRSVLNDVFREAIVAGVIERNPVEPTRAKQPRVQRSRLSVEQFRMLLEAVPESEPWFYRALLVAVVTAQRREDITRMRSSNVRDGRLFITQSKKGSKLAIPVDLALPAIGMTLNDVIELYRRNNPSPLFIYSAARRHGRRPGPVRPENLTQAFTRTRAHCGLDTLPDPPTFHEICSLSGRLYEAHYGQAFTQRLPRYRNLTLPQKDLASCSDTYVLV